MPDFNELDSVFYNVDSSIPNLPTAGKATSMYYPTLEGGFRFNTNITDSAQVKKEEFKITELLPTVSAKQLYENRRFPNFDANTINPEDQFANAQSSLQKGYRGVLKGLNIAGTTVLGGFGMLGGAAKWAISPDGKMSDIWNNDFMQSLDKWNNEVDQNYLPNYYTDKETNANWYERDNWLTANFLFDKVIKNSGFAVGAMVSGNIANGVLGAIGKGIGAAASAGAKSLEAASIIEAGVGTAIDAGIAANKFKVFAPILRNTARAFSQGKNIEAATILEGQIKNLSDVVLKNSKLKDLQKITNNFSNVADHTRRTAVSAYSAGGESGFEALQTSNEYRENLIAQYKRDNNNENPDSAALKMIDDQSNEVGKTSFLANLALLTLTEYIQLPKQIGSSFRSERQTANSLLGATNDVVLREGKYVAKTPVTKFGKLYSNSKRIASYVIDPKESAQELLQFGVQVGTQNYYKKSQQDGDADLWTDGFLYGMYGVDESGEGVGALNSKEGIEGGLIGGLTGGAMQSFGKRGNINQDKIRKSNTNLFIESINNAPTYKEAFTYRKDAANRASLIYKQQQDAVVQGQKLEALDLSTDAMHAYLSPRIKYGRFDMVMEDMQSLKVDSMSEEGLVSLKEQGLANENDTIDSFRKRVTEAEDFSKNLENTFKDINFRYSGEVLKDAEGTPILNSQGNQQRKYSDLVLDKLVYATTKIIDYENRIPQVNLELVKAGILNTQAIVNEIIQTGDVTSDLFNATYSSINRMNNVTDNVKDTLKSELVDLAELALRKKYFINEFNDIKNNPTNYNKSFDIIKDELLSPEIINSENQKENLKLNREYKILNPKQAKLNNTQDGKFEIIYPDNKVVTFDTEIEAKNVIDSLKGYTNLSKIKIIGFNQNGTVKIEDGDGDILNVDVSILNGYAGIKTPEEILQKSAEELKKQQDKLEIGSGTVDTTPSGERMIIGSSDKRKDVGILFLSSTSTSGELIKPYTQRVNLFFNNFKFFPKKKSQTYKMILVHPNNAEALGLNGIVQLSYDKNLTDPLTENETNVDTGFLAQVAIVQVIENKKVVDYFIDQDGNRIGKVGEQIDDVLDKIVFETMTSVSTETTGGYSKVREGQEEEAALASEAYKIFREDVFSQTGYTTYPFSISRGIRQETLVNGVREDNHIGDILGPNAEKLISTEANLIKVVTTDKFEFRGELLTFPKGTVLISHHDLLDFANNKKLNNKQSTNAFAVIEAVAKQMVDQSNNNKPVKINFNYSNFLQNILYWKSSADTQSPNQIGIDIKTMSFKIGSKSFPLSSISESKKEIIDLLQNAFLAVNNTKLNQGLSKKFDEYVLKNDELTTVTWPNYQTYLLSSKNPDGSSRSIEDTPLITHTSKSTESAPSYKQKYSVLSSVELPFDKIPVKEKVEVVVPKLNAPMIGEYVMDGQTQNSLQFPTGPVMFTATISEENLISAEIKVNDTINKIAENSTLMEDVTGKLEKLIEQGVLSIDLGAMLSLDKATAFAKYAAETTLRKIYKKQQADKKETAAFDKFFDAPTAATPSTEVKPELSTEKPYDPTARKRGRGGINTNNRLVGIGSSERMTPIELEIFKQWHAENVPLIPFEVLENIINTVDGREAWGVFENGVAKFVKGGLRATEYHEIFEGIYNGILSQQEQQALLNEFKSKQGTFTDRETNKKIAFSDATDLQAKERIADDFADFRKGKLPAKSLGEAVRNLFNNIIKFFKSFVSKPTLKDSLFKSINTGGFKQRSISNEAKSLSPQYRAIEGLSEAQTNDYINDMVAHVKLILFEDGRKDLLFNPENITGKDVFARLREMYEDEGEIEALGEIRYQGLIVRAIEYLRTVGISFNGDEIVSINDENVNQNDYARETFSTDWKKNSTGAIKFALSTLVERKALNQKGRNTLVFTDPDTTNSSINGYKLVNFSKVFATLLDRLHNVTDPQVFANKIIELAETDSNYVPVFKNLGGNLETKSFNFETFNDSDWRYFIQFYNTFTKQKPEALIQYIGASEEVYTNNANIFTNVNQAVNSWVDNMRIIGKGPGGLISYDNKARVYNINSEVIKKVDTKLVKAQLSFLNNLGVEFTQGSYNALDEVQRSAFAKAVTGIQSYLGSNNQLMTFDAKTLGINGQLRSLATLYIKSSNPNQDSTYFGVEGQRVGSFSENNAPSSFENDFNESDTLAELLEKRPELNDVFSKGSQVLKLGGNFFNEDGDRIAEIKVEYIQGTKNEFTGKNKATAKLTLGERYIQEINQNLNGKYYILIPADSSTEWMMNLGNVISMDDVMSGKHWNKIYDIYNSYLEDEINLALENRTGNSYVKSKAKSLRFLKDVLSDKNVIAIEQMIQDNESLSTIQEYITSKKSEINNSIKELIETASQKTIDILIESNQISTSDDGDYSLTKFDSEFLNNYNLNNSVTEEQLKNFINFTTINYEINNIEFHKFIFGDPYQFKEKNGNLDETKRIKSFLSPRGRTFNMPEYDSFLNNRFNSVNEVELDSETPGYHEYKPYTNTVTFDTVNIVGSVAMMNDVAQDIKDAYAKTDETDAMSWLMDNTHKEIALKEGKWSDEAEAFHQWQMAYTRRAFDAKKIKEYSSEKLRSDDNKLLEKESPKHKLAVRKPIVSGNKYNKTEINLLLDKTSQIPLYYNMVEGTNLENMYVKMFKQKIGYGIVVTGRKVGVEELHPLYNTDGSFNTNDFANIIEADWKSYGTQVETASEGEKTQTRGSQLTKLASMDLFENGVASSVQAQTAYDRNKNALDALNQNAYNQLLVKLGIEDLGQDGFVLNDGQAISETLMYEMMRRELSENAKDTIRLNADGQFIMPFEASPSFTQIRSILYSMINKALISPSMTGSPHVQVPVTMFEQATEGRSLSIKTDNGWKKLSKNEYKNLSEEEKKKVLLTDDTLKFYTKDAPYCEVLIPAWFRDKIAKGRTNEELLKYLNTVEGGKILEGIGFRIPTQALSSVEVFKVKGFLPDYMGSTVVVPSEITTKAGSDFDIDKLNMYLKSVYLDRNGNIQLVTSKGDEKATKEFYRKVFKESNENKAFKKTELIETIDILVYGLEDKKNLLSTYGEYIMSIQDEYSDPFEFRAEIEKQLEELTDANLDIKLIEQYANSMYKKSLENEYYDSLKELLTLPENFDRLLSPINDSGLEAVAKTLDVARGYDETKLKNRLIDRNYMTPLRHSFITGKRWVGIAAVNITNLSLRQKSKTYLDPSKLQMLSEQERKFVKDLNIVLPHNTVSVDGANFVSLSGTKTSDGKQYISERMSGYATAFVDIATNPFITKIIKSDIVVSTFMFLESIGAGNNAALFLNQPIIEKYLGYLDSVNSKSVMGKLNLEYIKSQFPTTEKDINNARISVEGLYGNIANYTDKKGDISSIDNAEQHLILDEFIKYKILADQLFTYTQASNYDTTKFSSSDLLLKKEWATLNASATNLISNIGDVLDKNFIGNQAKLISKSINSLGVVIKTEMPEIKAYTLSTLKKYATKKFMSADDFDKISNLIRNSFLDYIIQSNSTVREMIKPLLVEGGVAKQLTDAKLKYPNIKLLQDFSIVSSMRENGAKSIELKTNIKAAYDENLYVGMMRELRDSNEELNILYKNIVNVAILQGSSQSSISIRNIIPVEDYSSIISPIINQLSPGQELEAFANAMFERNNFNNSELFTEYSPNVGLGEPREDPNTGEDIDSYTIYGFTFIPMKVTGQSRQLLKLSDKFNYMQVGSDFIKVPKVISKVIKVNNKTRNVQVNVATGLGVTKRDYAIMKAQGNFDLFDNYYYKKVYTSNLDKFGNKIPLVTYNPKTKSNEYYYKLINVYGDGNRAVEFNKSFTPSVIDNGSIKTPIELSDEEITSAFQAIVPSEIEKVPEITPSQPASIQGDSQQEFGFNNNTGQIINKEDTVESLRAEEQVELQQDFPNITPVDGKIIKESLNTKEDITKFDKIYDRYDLLITPLLDAQKEKQLSSEVENNTESKEVSKSDLLKTLFVKDTGRITKGSVVDYNGKKWIVWNISETGKAQLIDTQGNKFSGTPNLDKLTKIGDYTTTVFDGTDYIVTQNENIYSLATGKQVFTNNDGSTLSKKDKIINQIMKENDLILSETNVSLVGKPQEIPEEQWISLTEEERNQVRDQSRMC